jgi:hypothetical protein
MASVVNGRRFSFSSSETHVLRPDGSDVLFIAIDAISYSDKLNMSFVMGANRAPVGVTSGVYEPDDCTLSLAKSDFQTGIVEAIGNGWMGKKVKIQISYADEGEPLCTDEIIGFLTGSADDHSAGPDHLKVSVTVKAILIQRNGVTPLENHLL